MVKINSKEGIKLEPVSTAPTAAKGIMYYDSASDKVKVSTDGTTFKNILDETNVGTGANNIVQLDSNSKLPAVDGSQLTDLPAGGSIDLGEIRMYALSETGAVTKASLQAKGLAICDGTTPVSQGISSPTITTTPDLQHKFIRMSNDESSGSTGGNLTHSHTVNPPYRAVWASGSNTNKVWYGDNAGSTNSVNHEPPYYEVAFFIKVK